MIFPELKNTNEDFISIDSSSLFLYEAEYMEYLDTKISNQNNLFRAINRYTGITEGASMVMLESVGDKVKSKWNNLVEFVKTMVSKFMESITNILLNEKDYLEKYKDIILKKPPKSDMKYSYTGDYKIGIDRLINTELPLFNYGAMAESLKKEGDYPVIQEIILKDKAFTYDADKSVASNFKDYFIAADKGTSSGTFDQLKMVDLYNFCMNFKKMEDVVKKDQTRLNNSSSAIQAAMADEIRKAKAAANDAKNKPVEENPDGGNAQDTTKAPIKVNRDTSKNMKISTGAKQQTSGGGQQDSNNKQNVDASAIYSTNGLNAFSEKVEVTNSDATKSMSTYSDENKKNDNAEANAKGAAGELTKDGKPVTEEDAIKEVDALVSKWTNICRNLIGAKLTAVETIAKDYMTIIRNHVRSYGGQDLKKVDDRTETATNYKKNSNNNNQNTDQQQQQTGDAQQTGGGEQNQGNK
jgi:hypothetical protein